MCLHLGIGVPHLSALRQLHELGHGELDLAMLWSVGQGGSRGLSRSCSGCMR